MSQEVSVCVPDMEFVQEIPVEMRAPQNALGVFLVHPGTRPPETTDALVRVSKTIRSEHDSSVTISRSDSNPFQAAVYNEVSGEYDTVFDAPVPGSFVVRSAIQQQYMWTLV